MHYRTFRIPLAIIVFSSIFLSSAFFVFAQTTAVKKNQPTPTTTIVREKPQGGINVSLTPTFLNLITDPGKEVNSQFQLINNNTFTEYFTVEVAKFEIGAGGKPLLSPAGPSDVFTKWISFEDQVIEVGPNQRKIVKFTITPPESASLGYYYALIIKRAEDTTSLANSGAAVAGAPALLTLMEVRSPNAKRELQLIDFKTDKVVYEYLPTEFIITVKNTGNVHIVPTGNIFIDQGGKEDLARLFANEARGNVLPQSERAFTASWQDGFAVVVPKEENGAVVKDSKGNTVYTTKFDFQKADKFRIGKYTAHLLLVYDNGERDVPIEATISFWIIPWKFIGGALLILLFTLFGIKALIWSPIRKALSHGKKS
jgi:hypothetical protein